MSCCCSRRSPTQHGNHGNGAGSTSTTAQTTSQQQRITTTQPTLMQELDALGNLELERKTSVIDLPVPSWMEADADGRGGGSLSNRSNRGTVHVVKRGTALPSSSGDGAEYNKYTYSVNGRRESSFDEVAVSSNSAQSTPPLVSRSH